MAETRPCRPNTCFIKCNRDGQKPARPVSGWGLEFLPWFKRSAGVGDEGAGGQNPPPAWPLPRAPAKPAHDPRLCFSWPRGDAGRLGKAPSGWEGRRTGKKLQVHPCCPPKANPAGAQWVSTSSSVKWVPGDKPGSSPWQSTVAEMPCWDKLRKSSMGELGLQPPGPPQPAAPGASIPSHPPL